MYIEEQPYVLQKVADLIASFWALFLFTDNKAHKGNKKLNKLAIE